MNYHSNLIAKMHLELIHTERPQVLGAIGERYTMLNLEHAGYVVRRHRKRGEPGDMTVIDPETDELLRVEVKTGKENEDGRWWFRLFKKDHTDHSNTDILILVAVSRLGMIYPFIMPTSVTPRHAIVFCEHPHIYGGKYAKFRVRDSWRLDNLCGLVD